MAKFCPNCGKEIPEGQAFCSQCGTNLNQGGTVNTTNITNNYNNVSNGEVSEKSRLVALLLCIFFGGIGVHRFYAGKTGTGILWLLTLGCFGIGTTIDLIMIICGSFTDSNGKPIKKWED